MYVGFETFPGSSGAGPVFHLTYARQVTGIAPKSLILWTTRVSPISDLPDADPTGKAEGS